MSMLPKGGETIWGGLDWSPEQGYVASKRKENTSQPENSTGSEDGNIEPKVKHAHYGRIISFGKDVAEADSSDIQRVDFRVTVLIFFCDIYRMLISPYFGEVPNLVPPVSYLPFLGSVSCDRGRIKTSGKLMIS